jgi:hypothetical protein
MKMKRRYLIGLAGIAFATLLTSCSLDSNNTNNKTTTTTTTTNIVTTTEYVEPTVYNVTNTLSVSTTVENGFTHDEEISKLIINKAGGYSISGALNGSIECASTLQEKVTLVLDGATITSDASAITWLSEKSKVEIKAKKDTTNYLVTNASLVNETSTLQSNNNVEFGGKGTINITNSQKHAVSASEVQIKGEVVLNVTANIKDGIHAKQIDIYSGNTTITATKDAIEAEVNTKGNKGTFTMTGGTLTIKDSEVGIKAATSISFSNPVDTDPIGITLKIDNVSTPMDSEEITNTSSAFTYLLDGESQTI